MALFRRRKLMAFSALGLVVLAGLAAYLVWGGGEETYLPGERTDGLTDTLARELPADHPRIRFEEVAAAAGLDFRHFPAKRSNRLPEDMGSGVALGDVDGDGWVDVYLVNVSGDLDAHEAGFREEHAPSRLYHNRGDGTFEDWTERSGVGLRALGMAAAFADLDSDGDLDLFVTAYGGLRLYRNRGDGTFEDRTLASGVSGFSGFWAGVAVGDLELDGDLDLYVCGYVKYSASAAAAATTSSQYGADIPAAINPSTFPPERNLLFQNRGDGTFDERAVELGVDNPTGRSLEAVLADFTDDGLPDLYVANDVSDNVLFVNRGQGRFEDATARAMVGDYRGAMGLAVGDFDADSDFDLYITHWVAQENGLYVNLSQEFRGDSERPELMFMDEADRHGLGHVALRMVGWATGFFDYDNDGNPDLFVVNGSTIPLRHDPEQLTPMCSQLFWNQGPGKGFVEVGSACGDFFGQECVGRGGATFDYDLDGDEDLLVLRHGGPVALLRNDDGHRAGNVRLRLRQPEGNRFAVGAVVEATVAGRTRRYQTDTQGSYLSWHAAGELSIGLGGARELERLDVRWPDGTSESIGPVPAFSLVEWTRGSPPAIRVLPGRLADVTKGPVQLADKKRFFELLDQTSKRRVAGDFAGAAAGYREALTLWPGHEDCLYYLGNCQIELGLFEEAAATFRLAASYRPESSRLWMQIGRLCLSEDRPALFDLDEAERSFLRAHEINGEESGPVVQLGVVALLRDDRETAERWFADSCMLNTRCVRSRWYRGWLAWHRGQPAEAEACLAEARSLAAQPVAGASVSNEGDTRSGRAMVSGDEAGDAPLERWRSLGERSSDARQEYEGLRFALRRGGS